MCITAPNILWTIIILYYLKGSVCVSFFASPFAISSDTFRYMIFHKLVKEMTETGFVSAQSGNHFLP